jgi:hypothetical protein
MVEEQMPKCYKCPVINLGGGCVLTAVCKLTEDDFAAFYDALTGGGRLKCVSEKDRKKGVGW